MTPYDTSAELLQLLGRLADGQLSGRDHDKLLEILRENGDARAFYLDYMEVHALLEWKNIGDRRSAIDVIPDLEARGCGDYEVSAPPALFPLPSPLSSSFVGGPVFSYMVASVVLCLMLLGAW
ncbi:MAG: hypothetical protein JW959_12120, partial [Pirellulales bacterium]|nr:hypothetical protein [Pirellulales bacterium]